MNFLKNWMVTFVAVLMLLFFAELCVRFWVGVYPGQHLITDYFRPVKELKQLEGFYTDSAGVLKVSPEAALEVNADSNGLRWFEMPSFISKADNEIVTEVYILPELYYRLRHRPQLNELARCYDSLHQAAVTDFDCARVEYCRKPVNEGFRSIAFKPYRACKKKVLLLGDSFTWGHSADNVTASFADMLLASGYAAYNTGISGADPAQYLTLAEAYIPRLKPDVVVVNFFLGNDVTLENRHPSPDTPILYSTNAGSLYTYYGCGYYASAQQAYNAAIAQASLPRHTLFARWCACTALGTLLWKTLWESGWIKYTPPAAPTCAPAVGPKAGYAQALEKINGLCQRYGSRCIVVAIPEHTTHHSVTFSSFAGVLDSSAFYHSPVPPSGYKLTDGHFNDAGHAQYASFLEQLIK